MSNGTNPETLSTFTGTYDAGGALVAQTMPGGLSQTVKYDEAGNAARLTYTGQVTQDGTTIPDGAWLAWTVQPGGVDVGDGGGAAERVVDVGAGSVGALVGDVDPQRPGTGRTGAVIAAVPFAGPSPRQSQLSPESLAVARQPQHASTR